VLFSKCFDLSRYSFNPSVELAPIVDEVLKQTQEEWRKLTDGLSQNGWERLAKPGRALAYGNAML
jgi:hypothetical protein